MNSNYALMSPQFFKDNIDVISMPGTYEARVRNVSDELASLSPINKMGTTRVITLSAIFAQDVPDLQHMMAEALAEGKKGLTWEEAGKFLVTFNLESNNIQYKNCPVRGEKVDVIVEKVLAENKSGNSRHEGEEILVTRNIKIYKGMAPTKFKFDFSPVKVETESEGVHAE